MATDYLNLKRVIDNALGQNGKIRHGGAELCYYCKCGHHKRKLEISLDKLIFHCWVCNDSGTIYKLFKTFNVPQSVRDELYQLTKGIRPSRAEKTDKTDLYLPDGFVPLSRSNASPEYKNAIVYLIKRNIIPEDIIRYNMGFATEGEYEHHIIIPSYDSTGKLNYFIGRRYYDINGQIPYKKPDVSMNIVGFENLINYSEDVNLCEGCFDCFAIRNNAIPLFGKYISDKLKEALIINKTKRVNMILDNDALRDAVNNCVELQKLGINVHLVRLEGKDPSVLGFKKIHELIKTAPKFTFEQLIRYKLKK